MIGYLEGELLHRAEETLLIKAGPVGYEVTVTAGVLAHLGVGEHGPVRVFTHTHQPQGFPPSLFGFHTLAERELFRQLIEVNTVGPKVAIKLLALPFDQLLGAIARKDVALLSTVKGLGKKTAEKICLDLAEKVGQFAGGAAIGHAPHSPNVQDAELVLRQLGFTPAEVNGALAELDASQNAEELVAQALKLLGR